VLAVSEIASNAVRHGSPRAQLLLRADLAGPGAEVSDSGRWRPGAVAVSPTEPGGMGLLLAYLLCDDVGIQAGPDSTRVRLRMSLPAMRQLTPCPTDRSGHL
jgi:anti-sigma regulatory factor (Ser/Thr protein kinase)